MKRWRVVLVVLGVVAAIPACLRPLRIDGPSDAPAHLWGDVALAWRGAYALGLLEPRPGHVVVFDVPQRAFRACKRVVAGPGDVVELRQNRLLLNGHALEYRPLERRDFDWVPGRNLLGTLVAEERGGGPPRTITYTPGLGPQASFGPLTVPAGHCFVLGDNRDRSEDSRSFGPLPFSAIRGRIVGTLQRRP